MAWKIEFDSDVEKDLKGLDKQIQRRLLNYLTERVIKHDDPRRLGAPLRGKLSNLWKYRVGDYRIISRIEDEILTVLVVHIGHRKNVYKNFKND